MRGTATSGHISPEVGIVIPTHNAAAALAALLPTLTSDVLTLDIVVSDAGSSDCTIDVASRFGARVIDVEGGRGAQLRAGTHAVLGDWILLLHADCRLPPGWDTLLAGFIDWPFAEDRAGFFRFALDDGAPEAQRLQRMVAWRCRSFGLPYGDQGLFISRSLLEQLGGVPPLPLMEDVALVRAIGKKRLISFDADLVTSAEKFRKAGYLRRSAWNLLCLALYLGGVPPRWIRKLYG